MYKKYLVTGATGFLGNAIINRLKELGADIRVLIVPKDKYERYLPKGIEICYGYVNKKETLKEFFSGDLTECCLIHSAGIISIGSTDYPELKEVNINGTKNIMEECKRTNIKKVVYVSSVHAIEEKPKGNIIEETKEFEADKIKGYYAKSKAEATKYVLEMAEKGLPVSVVHPSGIIGPDDYREGNMTSVIISYCKGQLPCSVNHGYDFVDVRDVAEGIISCCNKGRNGECYILANRNITIDEMLHIIKDMTNGRKIHFKTPLWLLKMVSYVCEKRCIRKGKSLYLTPYSVYTMGSNSSFSHQKATKELDYHPRDIKITLYDMVKWLKNQGKI